MTETLDSLGELPPEATAMRELARMSSSTHVIVKREDALVICNGWSADRRRLRRLYVFLTKLFRKVKNQPPDLTAGEFNRSE